MEIILNLFGKTGFYNTKSVIIDKDEKIKIRIICKQINGVEYFLNGKKVTNNIFEIDNKPGVYNFIITACRNGNVIKKWDCEPLIIREFDNKNELIGELDKLSKDTKKIILEQNIKIKEMYNILNDFKKELNELHELVYADLFGGEYNE